MRLFLTCWLVYVLHFATNTVREIYPALSLGDHLSFDVAEYAGLHPDLFEMPDGRWFSNNNPGASIMGAIPYLLTRPIIDRVVDRARTARQESGAQPPEYDSPWPMAREFFRKSFAKGYDLKFGLAAGVMQAGLMAPLSALSAVVMFYLLLGVTGSARASVWLAVLYAFATPVFYRTAQLNQNLIVCHCALFAFALLWRPWDLKDVPRKPAYFIAGLLSGWAVVCDYSGLIVPVVLGFYGLVRRSSLPESAKDRFDSLRFASGVLMGGAVLLAYQWSSFGNPLWPAQHYMPAANFTERGYVGFDWPQLDLLFDTAFSIRFGLFTSAPILLAVFAFPYWRKGFSLVGRRELICILAFCVVFFIFCGANQYGRMQFNTGVRHIVPITPFVFLLAVGVLLRMPRPFAVLFGVVCTYWSWCLAMYRDVEVGQLGIADCVANVSLGGFELPWLRTLERMGSFFPEAFRTGGSAIAILAVSFAMIYCLWTVSEKKEHSDGMSL